MAEIEIFGAGIFGLTVAWHLHRRGAKIRVIEKRQVGAGASGGVVGALAPHTPDNWNAKKQFQFESLIANGPFWAEIDTISGLSSGYGQTGRLVALDDQREVRLAQERHENAKSLWRGHAEWLTRPAADFAGWGPSSTTGQIAHDTLSARILPKAACASLAQALRQEGVEILEGQTCGKGGDLRIDCTGYEGLESLSQELDLPFGSGVKGQGLLVAHDAADMPQIYAGGLHIIPHADGTTAIGSTSESQWSDPVATDRHLAEIHRRAALICPALAGKQVLARWAGVRPRGRRRAPILGRHPANPNHFIANGGFKIGFGVAVRVGQLMADLVLDGVADIPDQFTVAANLRRKWP